MFLHDNFPQKAKFNIAGSFSPQVGSLFAIFCQRRQPIFLQFDRIFGMVVGFLYMCVHRVHIYFSFIFLSFLFPVVRYLAEISRSINAPHAKIYRRDIE